MLLSLPSSAALPGVSSHHRECRAGSAGQKGKDAPCHPEPSPAIQRQQPRRDLGNHRCPVLGVSPGLNLSHPLRERAPSKRHETHLLSQGNGVYSLGPRGSEGHSMGNRAREQD